MSDKEQVAEQPDYLSMSDEEFLNAPPPADPVPAKQEEEVNTPKEEPEVREGDPNGSTPEEPEEPTATTDPAPSTEEEEEETPEEPDESTNATDPPSEKEKEGEVKPLTEEEKKQAAIDYEKAYKDLMTPFKANGRDIQVESVDDIRRLMQMGANYNKKMQGMKPSLRILKMLENNNLLSEEKLAFLIDLDKKDPAAISKLVKESGVDPLEIDEDKAKGYKAGQYSVHDKEVELDTVLQELESTPHFNKLISVVGKEWDATSRGIVAENPQMLRWINTHVESGIYDLISNKIHSERALGRLDGMSDYDAYRKVGDELNARGVFDHLNSTEQKGHQTQPVQKVASPAPKVVNDDKLKDKRRAASVPRTVPASKVSEDFNPLAMSDAEYEKWAAKSKHLM